MNNSEDSNDRNDLQPLDQTYLASVLGGIQQSVSSVAAAIDDATTRSLADDFVMSIHKESGFTSYRLPQHK